MLTTEEMEGAEVAVPGAELVPEFAWWLGELISGDGSDLHLKAGSAPKIRQAGGRLIALERPALTHADCDALTKTIVPPGRRERFETAGEVDFAYGLPSAGRFRVNVFRQRGPGDGHARSGEDHHARRDDRAHQPIKAGPQ